jgi:DnaJ-class molecular chaperone
MASCIGAGGVGMDPYHCPVVPCPGCPRVFIQAQGKAQLCPVCGGSGRLPDNNPYGTSTVQLTHTCHGCEGRGWVVV